MAPPNAPRPPSKDPPKVSQAYLTGKSSRPKAQNQQTVSLPIAKIFGAIAVVALAAAGFTAWQKVSKPLATFTENYQGPLPSGWSADDVAADVRRTLTQYGATPDENGITVDVAEPSEEKPDDPQSVTVAVRYRVPVFGVGVNGSLDAKLAGKGLIPSRYAGDGTPQVKAGAEKLRKVLSTARCPDGTVQKGEPPPKGTETWCEKPGPKGKPVRHGPYFAWHPNGNSLEEGSYVDGKRNGKWTRFNLDGAREAEAFYKDDVQHGRFRRWDANGTQVMDVEYRDGAPVTR